MFFSSGDRLISNTKASESRPYNSSYVITQGDDYVTFDVMACKNAHVALMQVGQCTYMFMYEFVCVYTST